MNIQIFGGTINREVARRFAGQCVLILGCHRLSTLRLFDKCGAAWLGSSGKSQRYVGLRNCGLVDGFDSRYSFSERKIFLKLSLTNYFSATYLVTTELVLLY